MGVLGQSVPTPWTPVALWTVLGGSVGAPIGFVAGFGFLRRGSAAQAGVDAARRG